MTTGIFLNNYCTFLFQLHEWFELYKFLFIFPSKFINDIPTYWTQLNLLWSISYFM